MQNPMERPKKRSRHPENWKQHHVKRARVNGTLNSYSCLIFLRSSLCVFIQYCNVISIGLLHINYKAEVVPAKARIDVQCRCHPQCAQKFTEPEKDFIFSKYYGLGSHEEQTLYLRGCMVKTREENNAYANEFYLKPNNISILVCQKYFLGILGIKRSRLRRKVTYKFKLAQLKINDLITMAN